MPGNTFAISVDAVSHPDSAAVRPKIETAGYPTTELEQQPTALYNNGSSHRTKSTKAKAWYDLRGWFKETNWTIVGFVTVLALLVGIIVGAVVGDQVSKKNKAKSNQYPDYGPLRYRLVDDYMGPEFFDKFDYFSDEDPTYGFVQYVDRGTANALNLSYVTNETAVIRVDTSNPLATNGRQSVRIESKPKYDHGLFIFDIVHSPFGCGLWPALWLTDGYNWPKNGEIDIVETSNEGTDGNTITLHTTGGCKVDVRRNHTGETGHTTCDDSMRGDGGCDVQGPRDSYGEWLNGINGGVYALELRNAGIRAWFFRRNEIPADIADPMGIPNPSAWIVPLADFPNTHCDIPSHFSNQSIIVNIDLCGTMGASSQLYTELYQCPGKCQDFVASNPDNFTQAYWEFKGFKVYQALNEHRH